MDPKQDCKIIVWLGMLKMINDLSCSSFITKDLPSTRANNQKLSK